MVQTLTHVIGKDSWYRTRLMVTFLTFDNTFMTLAYTFFTFSSIFLTLANTFLTFDSTFLSPEMTTHNRYNKAKRKQVTDTGAS